MLWVSEEHFDLISRDRKGCNQVITVSCSSPPLHQFLTFHPPNNSQYYLELDLRHWTSAVCCSVPGISLRGRPDVTITLSRASHVATAFLFYLFLAHRWLYPTTIKQKHTKKKQRYVNDNLNYMWMITSVRWSQYRYIGYKLYSYIVIKQQHQQLMASKFGPLAGHSYRGHGTSEGIHPELRRTAGAGASDAEKAPDVSNAAERTGRTGWLHRDLMVI